MITINKEAFFKLQGYMSETDFSKKINVSRTHLWRAKQGLPVGESFIAGFKAAYPDKKFEDYFIVRGGTVDEKTA